MSQIQIELPAPHTDKQRQLIVYPGNICILGGRRWGKTEANVQRIYYWMEKKPGLYWWAGLSWKSASMKKAWREVTGIARQILTPLGLDPRNHINRSRYEVSLPGLGEIWFRTADNPASMAGEGIQGVVVDEFTLMREIVWDEYLQATLLDYGGWASFAGVPKGNNWGANLYRKAATTKNWLQLHATTYENPYIDPQLIDDIKETTPQAIFEQEYLAKIHANLGTVFKNYERCMTAVKADHKEHRHHRVVMGNDWGKHNDFTTTSIGCADCKKELFVERSNNLDYSFQVQRIKAFYDRWSVKGALPERNAMGEPIIEQLQNEGLNVLSGEDKKPGFNTTASTKPPLIENLSLTFEQGDWEFIDDPIWNAELASYERKVSQYTGRSSYSAPEGMNDDTVISRALMVWAASQPAPQIAFA